MAKVIGLGGLFFLCKDVEATRAWYARVLGIRIEEFGGSMFSHATAASMFPRGAQTVWSPFKGDSTYFKPSDSDFMMNLMVDDMPGMIARLQQEGVELQGEPLNESYGHFVWVMDPDGRKVELWQPVEPADD
ncbi:MAG: VOC family protein [Alphaproteobacteria bacterium]|nr:VOC family protein [Alphaproteobacteria bacterium]MBU2085291.1 VOC family protein [Alphaproteobacteria bacterium]MBU2142607.1 VOC family protein [Alphaproteobacteria bacterium]MBU2196220.1 VOC family protein [Alphaproteobacteria bacterium]